MLSRIVLVVLVLAAQASVPVTVRRAEAGCTLIPIAERQYSSTLGSVSSPIAAPGPSGKPVTVTINPTTQGGCDLLPIGVNGFDVGVPANNVVTLTFEPPMGPTNPGPPTAGPTTPLTVAATILSPTALRFNVPDTSTSHPPFGLAGPARITVTVSGQTVVDIGPLFQPTRTCDHEAESVFGRFIVLPPPNDVSTQINTPTRILMTVDGGNNLLIPLNHVGVLPAGPGAPIARLLRGDSTYPAFDPLIVASPPGLSQQLAQALALPSATSGELLRSFTVDGRPLPPLLRLDATGAVFGATDADVSVLRIPRLDENDGEIFDVTTRLSGGGKGPVVINPAFTLHQCDPVPIRGITASDGVAAFARDESVENTNLNSASGDPDKFDRVVQLVQVATGGHSCGSPTGMAVTDSDVPGFSRPALESSQSLVAFLESEADQNQGDLNADGDAFDSILRVFAYPTGAPAPGATPTPVNRTASTNIAVDPQHHVNQRSLAISEPYVFFRSQSADLSFLGETSGVGQLTQARGTAVSSDGKFLYVTGRDGANGAINVFSRNLSTGALTFIQAPFNSPVSYRSLTLSPDGLHLYVGTSNQGSIASEYWVRNTVTGQVTGGGSPADPPYGLPGTSVHDDTVISADGLFAYIADSGRNTVEVWSRNPGTGNLTFIAPLTNGSGGVQGVGSVSGLALSPDGRHLYAAGFGQDAVAVFSRDPSTGNLTFVEAQFEGLNNVTGLSGPLKIAVSPDGKHVYTSSVFADTAVVFSRDATTGALTFVHAAAQGGGNFITISPDGTHYYVTDDSFGEQVKVFSRNPTTGALTFIGKRQDGVAGVTGLNGPQGLSLSPDSRFLYIAATTSTAVTTFATGSSKLQVFDSNVAALQAPAQLPASEISVASQRAAFLEPEGLAEADLNSDGDRGDEGAELYDASSQTVTSLGVAANRIALSDVLVAMTVPEAAQGGSNLNGGHGDFDAFDDVLMVRSVVPPGPVISVAVAADAIAVSGTTVVFTTPECSEGGPVVDAGCPTGGTDLNGDGDADDRVLQVYRHDNGPSSFGHLTNVGQAAVDFIVSGNLVAFRSPECGKAGIVTGGCPSGGTDLNHDGDAGDAVMEVYDLSTDQVIPTGQAAIPCDIAGCEDKTPYQIKGTVVSFLSNEQQQNEDLNGDGDKLDLVLNIFTAGSRKIQRIFPVKDLGLGAPAPFPIDLFGGPILFIEASEVEQGRDLNGDGDMLDNVILLVGDQDGDGTVDDHDVCSEISNPDQADTDLDGLGDDVCDPNKYCGAFVPAPPPMAPGPCQVTIGKAALTYLKKRAAAIRGCLDDIAKGKIAGDPTALCRGSFVGDTEVAPERAKTASKLVKAAQKFQEKLAGCTDGEVGVLDTCGGTVSEVATCVAATYGGGVNAATDVAYGTVVVAGNDVEEKCQKTVGKASLKYLEKVTQAMQKCLDKVNAGDLVGDPQALCLGRMTVSGVTAPSNASAAGTITTAEANLRADITDDCPGATLTGLDACGTDPLNAGNCLVCTTWRRATAAIQGAYGPQ